MSFAASPTSHRNRLLSKLSPADLALLERDLERVTLKQGFVFEIPNRPVEFVYFIENGVKPERTFPVPYCVDNAYFAEKARIASEHREAFRAELGLQPGRPIILYASKFQGRKRPGDLLAAFANLVAKGTGAGLPYLAFVGDGELRVALEAQACGTPVVAASVGGLRTVVSDGRSGVLVDGHDPARWAQVVARLLGAPARLQALSDGARRHASAFGWSATVDGLARVYTGVMDEVTARVGA